MPEPRRRVSPLAPEERRAALIEVTLPLLRELGVDVSTRQIAQAAGVAEGTIFRVFPDKATLICAALERAFDPQPTIEALLAIPLGLPLRDRLWVAVGVLNRRFQANFPLIMAIRTGVIGREFIPPNAGQGMHEIGDCIAALMGADRHRLRHPPETVASLLVSLVMHSHRPQWQGEQRPLSPKEIVDVLLDGALVPESQEKSNPMEEIAC